MKPITSEDREFLAYKALLAILNFDASLKASQAEKQSPNTNTVLNSTERFAFYGDLLKKLNELVTFDAIEKKKIAHDLKNRRIELSFMVNVIGRKVLIAWTDKDVRSILKK